MCERLRLLLAALVVACAPETPHSQRRVDLVVEWDLGEPCLGSALHLDRFVERVFEFLGEDPGEFEIAVVYTTTASCKQSDEPGCYDPAERRVYVFDEADLRPLSVTRHELAHAILQRVWGTSAPFFEDGLAEAFTRKQTLNDVVWTPRVAPVADSLARSQVDDENAATFIRYLIDRGGLAAFRRVYRSARGKTRDELVALVESVYDTTFAELEADYLAGPSACTYHLDLCDPRDAVKVDPSAPWSTAIVSSYLSPEFYGVQALATAIHVEFAAAGRARARVEHDGIDTPRVQLIRCGDCGPQSVQRVQDGDEIDLAPGLYTFEVLGGAASALALEP